MPKINRKTFKQWLIILLVLITLFEFVIIIANKYKHVFFEAKGMTFDQSYTSRQVYDYFNELADNNGAEYAFEVLKKSRIKGRIDEHTLGHLIGYKLFEQQGIKGILKCTPEFTYACFHGVIIKGFTV